MGLSGHASGLAVVAIAVVFTILALIAFVGRMYARLGVARSAGLDDLFIAFAMLFSIATTVTMILQVKYGMGTHQDTIGPEEFMKQLKAFYVAIWVYNLSLSCTKISILLQYLRIFPQKNFRICAYCLLGIVVVYSLYTFFTAVFSCTPIRFFWDNTVEGGKCLDRFAIWFTNAGLNIATDIAAAVLPLPVLKQLELPTRQRRALMIVFGLAGFACIAAILRLPSLYTISRTTNISWENPMAAIWSNIEMNIALLCSCLPTIRVIFPRLFRSQLSISLSRSGGGHTKEDESGGCTPRFPSIKITTRPRDSTAAPRPYRSSYKTGMKSASSLEAFGRSLDGQRTAKQKSRCTRTSGSFDVEMRDYGEQGAMPVSGIQVVTAIEQEVEINGKMTRAGSESDSTRDLVRAKCYDVV